MIKVSIVKMNPMPQYPEILHAVQRALDMIGGIRDIVKDGDLVLINPSCVAVPAITDIDTDKVDAMVAKYGADKVAPEAIYDVDCDIFCPCELGAIINDETLSRLTCRIIRGCANNQSKEERHGDLLEEKGFVYAPDYITNAGGTVYDTDRLEVGNVSHELGKEKVSRIYQDMERVFEIADRDKIPTYLAADRMAEERIREIAEVKKYRDDLRP